MGPSSGGVYPTQGPYRPGLPASLAAAARCRHRVPAARATARCSVVPGAPACLCAALGHHQRRRGCPGPPQCQENNCGISLPGNSRRCLPRGEDPRDTGVPLTFSRGEKSLRSHGCAGENRRAHSQASDSWQPQQHCHQKFRGAESHSREFFLSLLCPSSRLRPGLQQTAGNQRSRSAHSRVHLLHPLAWAACPR